MNNTNGQEYRSKFKKAISGVNQALTLHYALEGLSVYDYDGYDDVIDNIFKKRMNVIDLQQKKKNIVNLFSEDYVIKNEYGAECTPGYVDLKMLWDDTNQKNISNYFITADGVLFCLRLIEDDYSSTDGLVNIGGNEKRKIGLFIDVNGDKKPNLATVNASQPRDQYSAIIYDKHVTPYGVSAEIMYDKK